MPWGGFIQGGDAALRRLSYSARVTRDIALDGVREREKPWWFLFIDPARFAYMKVTAVLWRRGSIPPPPNIPFFFFYSSACQPLLDSTRDDHENIALRRVAWVRSFRWGRVDGWAKIDRINRKPREYDDDDDEEVLVTRRASSDTLAWIMTGTRRANFIGYLTFRWFVVVGSMRASASRLRPTCWNFGLSREIPAPAPNVFLDRPLGEVSGMLADSTPCSNFSFLIFLGESLQGIVMIPSDGDIDWLEFRIKLWIFREDPLENDWEMIYLWLFDELPLISRERCGPLWWMKKNGVERRRNDSTNEWYYRSCYNDRRWKRIVNSRR